MIVLSDISTNIIQLSIHSIPLRYISTNSTHPCPRRQYPLSSALGSLKGRERFPRAQFSPLPSLWTASGQGGTKEDSAEERVTLFYDIFNMTLPKEV